MIKYIIDQNNWQTVGVNYDTSRKWKTTKPYSVLISHNSSYLKSVPILSPDINMWDFNQQKWPTYLPGDNS